MGFFNLPFDQVGPTLAQPDLGSIKLAFQRRARYVHGLGGLAGWVKHHDGRTRPFIVCHADMVSWRTLPCAYEFEHDKRESSAPGCRLPCPALD